MAEARRFALLVGSSEFDDPSLNRLKAPANDVEALARVLRDPALGNFTEVITKLNKPSQEVRTAVESFFRQPGRTKDDLLLFYFSGHGLKDEENVLFFATKDTTIKPVQAATALEADFVKRAMRLSKARTQVVLLDCCFSGAFNKNATTRAADTSVDAVGVLGGGGQGTVVITASNSIQYALEVDGDQFNVKDYGRDHGGAAGRFTQLLVEGLQSGEANTDGDEYISVSEAFDYVQARIRDAGVEQTPQMAVSAYQGRINIVRSQTKLPEEVEEGLKGQVGEKLKALEFLEKDCLNGEKPALKHLAWARLKLLQHDDSNRVRAFAKELLERYPPPGPKAPPGPEPGAIPARPPGPVQSPPGPNHLTPTQVWSFIKLLVISHGCWAVIAILIMATDKKDEDVLGVGFGVGGAVALLIQRIGLRSLFIPALPPWLVSRLPASAPWLPKVLGLCRAVSNWALWLVASFIGGSAILAGALPQLVAAQNQAEKLVLFMWWAAGAGAALGIAHWDTLRAKFSRTAWWIVLNALSWGAAGSGTAWFYFGQLNAGQRGPDTRWPMASLPLASCLFGSVALGLVYAYMKKRPKPEASVVSG